MSSGLESKPIPWFEILDTLFRRRPWILGTTILGLSVGIVAIIATPPRFKATTRIQLTAQPVSGPREAAMSNEQIQAELALMKSPALLRGVLEDAHERPGKMWEERSGGSALSSGVRSVAGVWAKLVAGANSPDPIDLQIQAIADEIRAEPVGRSNVVEISYVAEDPNLAAEFVNELVRRHVARIAELNETASARPLYEEERREALRRWQDARAALARFRGEQGANLLAGDENQLRGVLARLQSDKVAAETQVLELRARSEFLAGKIEGHPRTIDAEWTVTQDESVRLLRQRILELELQRSQALSRYTPQSTIVQDLDRQIHESQRLLESKQGETLAETTRTVDPSYQALQVDLVQTQAQLSAASARVRALVEQISTYRERLSKLEQEAGELERLEDEVTTARDLYRQYSDREEQARVTTVLGESGFVNVSVVEEAIAPATPLPARNGRKLSICGLAGLFLGVLSAFVLDALDGTVKNAAQASRLSGYRVIAEIHGR